MLQREYASIGLGLLVLAPIATPALVGLGAAAGSGLVRTSCGISTLDAIRRAYRSGVHYQRGELATLVTTSWDRLFLLAFASPVVLGLYEAAYRVIQPFYSVAAVVNDASAELAGIADRRSAVGHATLRRYIDRSLVLTIPFGFFCLAAADPAIRFLYGPDFEGAGSNLMILGMVITLGFTSGAVAFPLMTWGQARAYGNAVTAGGVANLVLNVLLIPRSRELAPPLRPLPPRALPLSWGSPRSGKQLTTRSFATSWTTRSHPDLHW